MKQITEDYVSYEVAKLLKEKEVDFIDCVTYYCEDEQKEVKYSFCGETNSTWEKRCCQAPTHQMALKWLREVHKINIVIGVASDDNNIYSLWKFDIWNGNYSIIWGDKREKFNSYEQAVEAAILYVLKNLI